MSPPTGRASRHYRLENPRSSPGHANSHCHKPPVDRWHIGLQSQFNRNRQEVAIKSFRCLGISLPVMVPATRSCQLKALRHQYCQGIKHWARAAPASMDDNLDSPNSDDSSSSSNSDDLFGSDLIAAAAATGTGSKSLPIIARSDQPIPATQKIDSDNSGSDTLLQTAIRGNRRRYPRG